MKKQKWYLKTWFICILFSLGIFGFAAPFFFIFFAAAIILMILQSKNNKALREKYGTIDELESNIAQLDNEFSSKKEDLRTKYFNQKERLEHEYNQKQEALEHEYSSAKEALDRKYEESKRSLKNEQAEIIKELTLLKQEEKALNENLLIEHYNLSEYDGITSEECKNKLSLLKNEEQELIRSNSYALVSSSGSKKEISDNIKQIIRCFNAECDNILMNISVKNIDSMRSKITKCFESLNKIFLIDGIQLSKRVLELKLEELNLVYTFELKREQEREQQRAIKEQMIEEEKVRREIEKQKAKLEKDQLQVTNEVNKLMSYLQKAQTDVERQLYVDKIKELEMKIKELETQKEKVLEREANALAGFVYVISNIGSFGEDIYKIGMTRRLEPMDRIKELSSASVPFEFDVHAMIFSDNAPELENTLHKYFEKQSVNRVNLRKEFFHVTIDEIEKVVKENYNNTVQFTRIPVAAEYRQTLSILKSEKE